MKLKFLCGKCARQTKLQEEGFLHESTNEGKCENENCDNNSEFYVESDNDEESSEGDGFVTVRQELLKQSLSVPVGDLMYGEKERLPFRMEEDINGFQVFYKEEWRDASSIDWDFV